MTTKNLDARIAKALGNHYHSHAARCAAALTKALAGEGRAVSLELAGYGYIVTRDTGENFDYAYEFDDVVLEEIQDEQGRTLADWDYTEWCQTMTPCEDLNVAAVYYLQENGRRLGVAGGSRGVLDEKQTELLDAIKDDVVIR